MRGIGSKENEAWIRSIAVAAIATVATLSAAQPAPLSLADAMGRALRHRPEAAAAKARLGQAFGRLQQARAGYSPSINLQAAATDGPQGAPVFGPLENPSLLGTSPVSLEGLAADPLKKQYGVGLTVTQTLIDF